MTREVEQPRDRARRVLIVVIIAVGLSLPIVVGLAFGAVTKERPSAVSSIEPATIWANVCVMQLQWADGDATSAATTFTDRLHQPLHELAGALFERSPSLASEILETKGRLEAAVAKQSRPSPAEVDELVRAVGAGLEGLGGPPRRSCD